MIVYSLNVGVCIFVLLLYNMYNATLKLNIHDIHVKVLSYLQHEFTGYSRLKADRITLQYNVMEHSISENLNEHDINA